MSDIYDLVVVGSGPFGIAASIEAKKAGICKVLLLEKGRETSQTIRQFYHAGKRVDKDYHGIVANIEGLIPFDAPTKEDTLEYFDNLLKENNIETIYNSEVEKIVKKDDIFYITCGLEQYKAKVVIIAIGKMGKPNKPTNYKLPISLFKKINYDINNCSSGEKILVVGGGNSAAEYAMELSGSNDVTLVYRRKEFIRLNDENLTNFENYLKENKLKAKMGLDITSVEDDNGKIKITFTDGSIETYDRLIYAIGGSTPVNTLQKCGISLNEKNQIILNDNLETSVKNMYAGGDIITSNGSSIVVCLNNAHKIIQSICKNK